MNGIEKENRQEREILAFINQFSKAKYVFLNGMCYWFAHILLNRFQYGEIVYDPIRGHFVWICHESAYDADGKLDIPARAVKMDYMARNDPILYERIVNECVLKTAHMGGDFR